MGKQNLPNGGRDDIIARMVNANFDELYAGIMTSGITYCVAKDGADTNSGLSWDSALLTIQAAVDKVVAYNGDRILVGPGSYDETVTVSMDQAGLVIVGCGNRGEVAIATETANAEAMLVRGDDVTLINIGVGADSGADYALKFTGDRFRAFGCKFEGADTAGYAVWAQVGTAAQKTAGTDGTASDFLFDDCEFAWTDSGFICASSDYGATTQGVIRNSRFHNCTTVEIGELDTGAIGAVRNLLVDGCSFELAEDGTAPTDFIDLNSTGCTGVIQSCRFSSATHASATIQLASGVLYVANMAEEGISAARPD